MIHPEYSINPGTPEDPPQVQTANDVAKNDPPPSYESLFGKIKRAKAESSGRVDFAKKSCSICTESGTSTIVQCISRKSSKDINTIIGGQHYTLLY